MKLLETYYLDIGKEHIRIKLSDYAVLCSTTTGFTVRSSEPGYFEGNGGGR